MADSSDWPDPCPKCGGEVRWSEVDGPAFMRIGSGAVSRSLTCRACGAYALGRMGVEGWDEWQERYRG
jgi:hypothetical protein